MARGALTFTLDRPSQAEAIEAALLPEMAGDVPGSTLALHRQGSTLVLDIEAEDEGALRAAVNSYLRWVQAALEAHDLARPPPRPGEG
jgi:tRNA threonylcarbamoyladenosine modification (KEOPS) complex  Pcc1 subunit